MPRASLRVRTGCDECKRQHRKCDELLPRCTLCQKNDTDCVRSGKTRVALMKKPCSADFAIAGQDQSERPNHPQDITSVRSCVTLDDFHTLPIDQSRHAKVVIQNLWRLFASMIERAIPYDTQYIQQTLATGWLEAIHTDSAVCSAFIAYTSAFDSNKTKRLASAKLHLEYETRTLEVLQSRIQQNHVSDNTILAAALHVPARGFASPSFKEMMNFRNGLEALMSARGGTKYFLDQTNLSCRISVLAADHFLANAMKLPPLSRGMLELPNPPESLQEFLSSIDCFESSLCSDDVNALMCYVKRLTAFKSPSRLLRVMSISEESWLFEYQYVVTSMICESQARYTSTNGADELVINALALFYQEILKESQHVENVKFQLEKLKCLTTSLDVVALDDRPDLITFLMWSCLIAGSGPGLTQERQFFHDWMKTHRLTVMLLFDSARSILWYDRLDAYLRSLEIWPPLYDIHQNPGEGKID